MLPPVLERLPSRGRPLLLRARRLVPEPRAEPAPAREPRVHRRARRSRKAPTSASRSTATPTAASSSTTPASSSPATSSPRSSPRACSRKEPGAKIIYDVRASWAVPETIERAGGVPLVNRVGHAFIKARMRKEDAAFAGEVSGHYYFRDFSQADSGVVPFLLMLELISKRGRKLSEILAPLRATLLHHRRDQHAGRRRRAQAAGAEGALRPARAASRTSTGSRSTPTTGTSTSARRTRSRCCASTSRRRSQELMEREARRGARA